MPAHVTGEGDPYRPEMLIWMGAEGAVLGYAVARPGELLPLAGESLQRAIEEPIYGPPHAPARIRVASAELAEALRAGHPAIDVVRAPTPELDGVLDLMLNKMNEDTTTEGSYLSPEIGPEAVAAFFRAAAGLFRATPWQVVPDDQSLFSVTIEPFGLHDAVISVIGRRGPFGFDPSRDLLAALAGEDDRIDPASRVAIEHELLDRFATSPEAREFEEIGACCFVTDLAATHLGATIATLDAPAVAHRFPTRIQETGEGEKETEGGTKGPQTEAVVPALPVGPGRIGPIAWTSPVEKV